MKLTDEKVAQALGWFKMRQGNAYGWGSVNTGMELHKTVPAFTTSLDAIVAEIEARGLGWRMEAEIFDEKVFDASVVDLGTGLEYKGINKTTASLALCDALLKYLKEPR